MNNANRVECWLAVHHTPDLGKHVSTLLHRYGDVQALCEARDIKVARPAASLLNEPSENYRRDLHWCQQAGHRLIAYDDHSYPPRLRDLPKPPPVLFALGDVSLLREAQITVVGSRCPTTAGLESAQRISSDLAHAGLVITSGLANGIDTAAHRAALAAQASTIAVVGTGLDIVYPAKNKSLAEKIAANGVLISEFSCATPPRPAHFPQRNRLMAALSLGVLVVEASERSGSLITARLAGEYGREVFAVPGSVRNPCVRGCHRLIRDGAHLVESAQDVLVELAPILRTVAARDSNDDKASLPHRSDNANQPGQELLSSDYQDLLRHMAYDEPISVDDLVNRSGLTAAQTASMLLILELRGWVQSSHQTYVRIK